jgi:hypothetical protein
MSITGTPEDHEKSHNTNIVIDQTANGNRGFTGIQD